MPLLKTFFSHKLLALYFSLLKVFFKSMGGHFLLFRLFRKYCYATLKSFHKRLARHFSLAMAFPLMRTTRLPPRDQSRQVQMPNTYHHHHILSITTNISNILPPLVTSPPPSH